MKAFDLSAINYQETARRINQLRCERGLSVKDLMELLNLPQPEQLHRLTPDQLFALSALLEVRAEDIIALNDHSEDRD